FMYFCTRSKEFFRYTLFLFSEMYVPTTKLFLGFIQNHNQIFITNMHNSLSYNKYRSSFSLVK
ncbi:MAG: hypothetical protein R3321_15080, partial [Nitrososphaeraceae archaeon]|nr:hypothetical protein [Nitrososphaeraceae archaeon]